VVKQVGLVILVLGLAVTGPGFRDKIGPDDDVVPSSHPAIRPLEIVTSSVSRGLASLRSPRAGFNTGEGRRAEIRRAADDLFDVGDIARRALGPHWKGLGSREREEFVALFRAALTHSFVTIVERYTADHVASVDEEVAGTFARVRSRITPNQGPEIRIEYRLSRGGSQWTVYDIVLDGVSLVSNYRSQFNSIIATSSVAELLERMRTEPSRRAQSPDGVAGSTTAEPETPARGRFAAGLLLGLGAASSPRSR
jgi:phospholipid transport system substrate-binding protein